MSDTEFRLIQNPRIPEDQDICGVTHIGGTGIEWICIREPHDKVYYRRKGDLTHRRGDIVFSNNRSATQHHMVRRWNNRPDQD